MVQPKQIAALLIAASLGGCGSYSMFDAYPSYFSSSGNAPNWARNAEPSPASDATGSTSAPAATAAADKPNAETASLFARASAGKPAPVSAAAAAAAPLPPKPIKVASAEAGPVVETPPAQADKVAPAPRGRAYLFRGVAGLIYSRGIDGLAERITRVGIPATVNTYLVWRGVVDQAIRDYRRDPQPIILIGHSMGGDAVLAFAETLNAADIPVNLLVTYDPTRIADSVPPNVERYINIFQSSNFMGGGNVLQGPRFHGHYASYNLKDHSEIIHINIEKATRIQEQLVAKIVALSTTPAAAEGEAVPVHFEVPADAPIELWDSGTPVAAHSGDTLKSIAATYHVPLWSLAEINRVSDRAPLSEGQRVIVPRHLVPMPAATPVLTPVSSYAPTER